MSFRTSVITFFWTCLFPTKLGSRTLSLLLKIYQFQYTIFKLKGNARLFTSIVREEKNRLFLPSPYSSRHVFPAGIERFEHINNTGHCILIRPLIKSWWALSTADKNEPCNRNLSIGILSKSKFHSPLSDTCIDRPYQPASTTCEIFNFLRTVKSPDSIELNSTMDK